MDRIEELTVEAGERGIEVHEREIPVPGMSAAYIKTETGEHIIIRQDGTQAERACWLAEELGQVTYGYSLYVDDELIGSTEYAGALEDLLRGELGAHALRDVGRQRHRRLLQVAAAAVDALLALEDAPQAANLVEAHHAM